jgi:hypothetical protein
VIPTWYRSISQKPLHQTLGKKPVGEIVPLRRYFNFTENGVGFNYYAFRFPFVLTRRFLVLIIETHMATTHYVFKIFA